MSAKRRSLAEQRRILEVAHAHGTPAAARWFDVSHGTVNRLRFKYDGAKGRRGRPTLEDTARAQPRRDCSCVMCKESYVELNPTFADAMLAAVALEVSFRAMDQEPWRADAACLGTPTGRFYPGNGEGVAFAKQVCERCTVREECLESQLTHGPYAQYGVWGGKAERARRRIIQQRRYDRGMAATPTCPDDESIGVPAPGDPSAPPAAYEGQPTFASGAKEARSLEDAHRIMRATHGPWDEPTTRDEEQAS